MVAGIPAIETERLSREVAGVRIVDDISVSVEKGEVLAVVGPSGSGKTSFLRLLNRLDEPTSGTVRIEGQDYREMRPRDLRRRVGMVMQSAYLFPGTVSDNVRYGPAQQGTDLASDQVEYLLEQVGLAGRGAESVAHLSGGEAQRVSLARAMATSPAVLLLDEPTSSLDEVAKKGVEEAILRVVEGNLLTCVMVSHDFAQAARMGDRVMAMRSGCVERIGLVAEVIDAQGMVR